MMKHLLIFVFVSLCPLVCGIDEPRVDLPPVEYIEMDGMTIEVAIDE